MGLDLRGLANKAKSALFVSDANAPVAEGEVDIDKLLEQQEKQAKSGDQLVTEVPGSNLKDINVPADAVNVASDTPVDFSTIYKAAGIAEAPYSAENFLEMLAALPKELPLAMRRQTVNVSLMSLGKTTGTTQEAIIADAASKLTALSTFVSNLEKRTLESNEKETQEIADLLQQVEEKKNKILQNNMAYESTNRQCQAEGERIDDIIEFFQVPSTQVVPAPGVPGHTPAQLEQMKKAAETAPLPDYGNIKDPTINKLKGITEGNKNA